MTEDQFIKISRELLYSEIWDISASGVAKKYNVPYAEMLKLCKETEIPIPPSGYWTKLSFGKPVIKISLPSSSLNEVILPTNIMPKHTKRSVKKIPFPVTKVITEKGVKIFESVKSIETLLQPLSFLTESEQQKVLLTAQQTQMPVGNMRLHKKIIAYKSVIKEWNKKDIKNKEAQRNFNNFSNRPPFLAGVISCETLPRVFGIMDALSRQIEYLGGSVNDDLSFNIRNENVKIVVIESQDQIKHEMTREEAKELLIYEDAKRHHSWASEPKIRKYDYVFNSRLRITIRKSKYFRDTDIVNIESRLGEMLIELYAESEVVRIDREVQEEAQRKREEEERLREEHRIRYNTEVERTIALTNIAQDYDVACKIRAYISALELIEDMNDETAAQIDWGNKKADWFDPTVARKDELFGKREHEKDSEQKALKQTRYY
ncbi:MULTISPECIES: hypothetical protein [Clostridium]|uniref:Uncharacterized protein n=1 Tax=Clostridium frigoriphilum TaxID=443253 RepID=A0ABU7URF4_9CLOT|nr:hypothetical protein [Clostridium sp. DSM 17811]MBU3100649.1 hypothetical protein [Clostridium sp. DSM 17811]